jgi:hypothetical protein
LAYASSKPVLHVEFDISGAASGSGNYGRLSPSSAPAWAAFSLFVSLLHEYLWQALPKANSDAVLNFFAPIVVGCDKSATTLSHFPATNPSEISIFF